MIHKKIQLKNIVAGANTHPSWSTGNSYVLQVNNSTDCCAVSFQTVQGKTYSKIFPKEVSLTPRFCYVLGVIKGEGANSLGKSNYRRFTFTNSDPAVINLVLEELDTTNFLPKKRLPNKCMHLLHFLEPEEKVIEYWAQNLNLPKSKFTCFDDKSKTSKFGVCHLYISDVLLRRVTELLQAFISESSPETLPTNFHYPS